MIYDQWQIVTRYSPWPYYELSYIKLGFDFCKMTGRSEKIVMS